MKQHLRPTLLRVRSSGLRNHHGVSDIPTAWFARWSNGAGPVIALGVMWIVFKGVTISWGGLP